MPVPELLQPFVGPLEQVSMPYCITGSVAGKLEYYREGRSDKHLRDIRFILAATPVDRAMIGLEVAQRGLSKEWHACTE